MIQAIAPAGCIILLEPSTSPDIMDHSGDDRVDGSNLVKEVGEREGLDGRKSFI